MSKRPAARNAAAAGPFAMIEARPQARPSRPYWLPGLGLDRAQLGGAAPWFAFSPPGCGAGCPGGWACPGGVWLGG